MSTTRAKFTIELPKEWVVHPIPAEAAPTSDEVFAAESPDGPLMNVRVRLAVPAPLSDVAASTESAVRGQGAQALLRTHVRIDGQAAIRLTFSLPVGASGSSQPASTYIAKRGTTLYVIVFGGPGKLDQKLADFIAQSVQFN